MHSWNLHFLPFQRNISMSTPCFAPSYTFVSSHSTVVAFVRGLKYGYVLSVTLVSAIQSVNYTSITSDIWLLSQPRSVGDIVQSYLTAIPICVDINDLLVQRLLVSVFCGS